MGIVGGGEWGHFVSRVGTVLGTSAEVIGAALVG